jgi:hypothetical protein
MKPETRQEKKNRYMIEWFKLHPGKYYSYQIRYWQKKLDALNLGKINKPA